MNAKEAREYISRFHKVIGRETPINFVAYSCGTKIMIADMDDVQLIKTALELQQWEIQAGKPESASVN